MKRGEMPRISAKRLAQLGGKLPASTIAPKPGIKRGIKNPANYPQRKTPLAKVGKQKAKRMQKNREYYASAEWRAKRKAVFERDGYRCTEIVPVFVFYLMDGYDPLRKVGEVRCLNRGEIVNGKQTARGLVCEEVSYGHRGNPDRIDTCKTRCKDCDRGLTPLERINHAHGFSGAHSCSPAAIAEHS